MTQQPTRQEVYNLFAQVLEAKEELLKAQAAYDTVHGKMQAILHATFPLDNRKA